jgi:hypothetical protein
MVVEPYFIEKIKKIGAERDVEKGGHYDRRMGCVNIWCTKDDKPSVWNEEIEPGQFDADYVGGLFWEEDENFKGSQRLFVEADPYALFRNRGCEMPREGVISEEEWESIFKWLQEKVMILIREAVMK